MLRWLLRSLPVLTVAGVAFLVLVLGAERPVDGVRVWGGPTDALSRFSGWIQLDAPASGVGSGDVVQIEAKSKLAGSARAELKLDRDARAELLLEFGAPPGEIELTIHGAGRVLGAGRLALARTVWQQKIRRLGGPASSTAAELAIAVAPLHGVFAVPFPGKLVGRVERQGRAVANARVVLASDGAKLDPERTSTDANGAFVISLRPTEHVATLRVSVETDDGPRGELFTSIPVLPGAILVEQRGAELVVRSPLERASADLALVSEAGRWFGARVALSATGDGSAVGSLPLPALPEARLWAVAAGDAALPSAASVGWPLFARSPHAEQSFDAVDRLLLDTRPAAQESERARRRALRRWALLLGLVGAGLSVAALLGASFRARKNSLSELGRELADEPLRTLLPARSTTSLLVAALLLLGFLSLVVIVAWRLL